MTISPKPSDRRENHPQRSFYAQENSPSGSNAEGWYTTSRKTVNDWALNCVPRFLAICKDEEIKKQHLYGRQKSGCDPDERALMSEREGQDFVPPLYTKGGEKNGGEE
jgi:hypothetical protein